MSERAISDWQKMYKALRDIKGHHNHSESINDDAGVFVTYCPGCIAEATLKEVCPE